MNSEDQKLKEGQNEVSNIIEVNNRQEKKDKVEKKDKEEKIDKEEPPVKKKAIIPFINYRKVNIFATSIINYFFIGICLFVFGCENLKFFKLDEYYEFCNGYYLISGIVLYFIGIFDWYVGKDLVFLIDFIYSFYFVSLYLIKIKLGEIPVKHSDDKLFGSFYAIFFCFIIVIAASYKNKGKIYMIDYTVLFCGYLFLFIYKYSDVDWIKNTFSYIFIVSGGFFWITGILKLIDNFLNEQSIQVLNPNED